MVVHALADTLPCGRGDRAVRGGEDVAIPVGSLGVHLPRVDPVADGLQARLHGPDPVTEPVDEGVLPARSGIVVPEEDLVVAAELLLLAGG